MKKVKGEKMAIAMVAVKPGTEPTTIPINVPRKTIRSVFIVNMRVHASTNWANILLLQDYDPSSPVLGLGNNNLYFQGI